MKRREFITLLGGAAAAWPLAARAQQPERMRRIGTLMRVRADDPEWQVRNAAFLQGLRQLGWIEGRNVRIDYRWAAGDAEREPDMRRNWWRSPRTSSWPVAARAFRHCCRQPAPCRSCSRMSPDPVGCGHCRQSGAARRQCHRLHAVRVRLDREMAGVAQGDRAGLEACGGPARSRR